MANIVANFVAKFASRFAIFQYENADKRMELQTVKMAKPIENKRKTSNLNRLLVFRNWCARRDLNPFIFA